jgi:hypothetical protein
MRDNNMTAVEWLRQELLKRDMDISIKDLFEQTIEMEKQQMKDAVLSQCTTHDGLRKIFDKQFEQYYNETYGDK